MFQYKQVSSLVGNGGSSSTPMELGADGDENDVVEISMEKLEAEAKEVRAQLAGAGASNNLSRVVLNSPPGLGGGGGSGGGGGVPGPPSSNPLPSAQRQNPSSASNKFRQD